MVEQQETETVENKEEEETDSSTESGQNTTETISVSKEDFVDAEEEDETEKTTEGNVTSAEDDGSGDPEDKDDRSGSDGGSKPRRSKGRPRRKFDIKLKIPDLDQDDQGESYKDLMITELKFKGIFDAVSNTEDRVVAKVFRLSQAQRNELQSIRKDLYSTFRKLRSFKVDKKYVIPKSRLPELEQAFQDKKHDFEATRIAIFKTLRQDWQTIVNDIKKAYPDLPIDFGQVGKMKPEDTDFLSMDYTIRSLDNWLGEMDGLKQSFAKGNVTEEEIAKRIDKQKGRIVQSVRSQYEESMKDLHTTIDKLKKAVKKSAKADRIEKLKSRADKAVSNMTSMAKLIGEEDAFMLDLEAMQETLSDDLIGDN